MIVFKSYPFMRVTKYERIYNYKLKYTFKTYFKTTTTCHPEAPHPIYESYSFAGRLEGVEIIGDSSGIPEEVLAIHRFPESYNTNYISFFPPHESLHHPYMSEAVLGMFYKYWKETSGSLTRSTGETGLYPDCLSYNIIYQGINSKSVIYDVIATYDDNKWKYKYSLS